MQVDTPIPFCHTDQNIHGTLTGHTTLLLALTQLVPPHNVSGTSEILTFGDCPLIGYISLSLSLSLSATPELLAPPHTRSLAPVRKTRISSLLSRGRVSFVFFRMLPTSQTDAHSSMVLCSGLFDRYSVPLAGTPNDCL